MNETTARHNLDERDTAILAGLIEAHEEREGPRVGDFVIWRELDGERVYRRVSHDWGEDVQTSDGGSFHLGRYGVSFSGSLHPSVPTADLVDTGETREGRVWFFHHDRPGAGRGVDTVAPFRVYAYVGETRLREHLAHWQDDEVATPSSSTHILHLVDADGHEIGNYPLDGFGEPVTVGRALREWERQTGIAALKASDVVTVQGQRATHYGVRVQVLAHERGGGAAVTERLARIEQVTDHYRPWNLTVEDWLAEHAAEETGIGLTLHPWLLVERSRYDGSHEFSTHATIDHALDYQAEQECAEDWDPVALVDLDTGDVAPLARAYRTVFDTFLPRTTVDRL